MKLYKIRGTSEWVPWDVLYNERGYNSVPCVDMAYKSISPWGTSAGTGYRTNGAGNIMYFVSGETGWKLAFNLPEDFGVYPDEATPIQMIKDGVISDAVWMEFFGSKWYLIQAEIANERYWIHELALPEYGWEIYEGKDYEFILVDGTTGRVVHGVEQINEMVFAPTGYFTIEDTGDVVFVEQSPYPIVSRFHVDFDTVQTLADGAYIDTVLPYYTSKLYIAGIVDRVAETVVDFGLTVSNEGGCVRVTNNTGASVTLTRLAIQSMDATDAEVVEVVDGQDNHAYAFKWDDGGTPYWWISYSGERHWTDSLGNWSEVPSVVLPTVSVTGDWGSGNWLYIGVSAAYVNANSSKLLYKTPGGQQLLYDASKSYAPMTYTSSNGGSFKSPVEIFTISGNSEMPAKVVVNNVTSSRLVLYSISVAICSSNQATVVTVYNSSNVAYNAFKFTASGTDYYYVLDGTQTDWTDDLASIGYSLTPAAKIMLWLSRYGDSNFNLKKGDSIGLWTSTYNNYVRMPHIVSESVKLVDLYYMYNKQFTARNVDPAQFDITNDGASLFVYNRAGGLVMNVGAASLLYKGDGLIEAYLTNAGSSGTENTQITGTFSRTLFYKDGTIIPYDSTSSYLTLGAYNYAGEIIANPIGEYVLSSSSLSCRSNGAVYVYKIYILKVS